MENIDKKIEDLCWKNTGVFGLGTCEELDEYTHCKNCPVYFKAGRNILNNVFHDSKQMEWQGRITEQPEEEEDLSTPLLIFRIGNEWIALKPNLFQSAVKVREVHFVPGRTNDIFRGIVNIDGELLLCISLKDLMGIKKTEKPDDRTNVFNRMLILNLSTGRVVFYVDEILGVKNISDNFIKQVPSTISNSIDALTGHIIEVDNYRIALIDDLKLEKSIERNLCW